MEVKEEILELQPMAEVTEAVSPQGEEEIIDLLDIIEEPVAKAEEAPAEVPEEAMKGLETRESEGGGLEEEIALDYEYVARARGMTPLRRLTYDVGIILRSLRVLLEGKGL